MDFLPWESIEGKLELTMPTEAPSGAGVKKSVSITSAPVACVSTVFYLLRIFDKVTF